MSSLYAEEGGSNGQLPTAAAAAAASAALQPCCAHCFECNNPQGVDREDSEAQLWPAGLPSPTIYFWLHQRKLSMYVCRAGYEHVWRPQQASATPSALRSRRRLRQLSVKVPSALTNVDPHTEYADYLGPVDMGAQRSSRAAAQEVMSTFAEPSVAASAAVPEASVAMRAGQQKLSRAHSGDSSGCEGLLRVKRSKSAGDASLLTEIDVLHLQPSCESSLSSCQATWTQPGRAASPSPKTDGSPGWQLQLQPEIASSSAVSSAGSFFFCSSEAQEVSWQQEHLQQGRFAGLEPAAAVPTTLCQPSVVRTCSLVAQLSQLAFLLPSRRVA